MVGHEIERQGSLVVAVEVGRPLASAIIAALMVACIVLLPQVSGRRPKVAIPDGEEAYHQGQVTVERPVARLQAVGIGILGARLCGC